MKAVSNSTAAAVIRLLDYFAKGRMVDPTDLREVNNRRLCAVYSRKISNSKGFDLRRTK